MRINPPRPICHLPFVIVGHLPMANDDPTFLRIKIQENVDLGWDKRLRVCQIWRHDNDVIHVPGVRVAAEPSRDSGVMQRRLMRLLVHTADDRPFSSLISVSDQPLVWWSRRGAPCSRFASTGFRLTARRSRRLWRWMRSASSDERHRHRSPEAGQPGLSRLLRAVWRSTLSR